VAAAVLLLPGPPALPEDLPCAEEQRTLCGAIAPGEGRVQSCLRARWGELSPTCRQGLDRSAAAAELQIIECEADLFRFCSKVPGQHQATLACLVENRSALTPTCRAAVDREQGRGASVQLACHDEVPSLCAAVPAGDVAGLVSCLVAHAKELTPACQAAVSL